MALRRFLTAMRIILCESRALFQGIEITKFDIDKCPLMHWSVVKAFESVRPDKRTHVYIYIQASGKLTHELLGWFHNNRKLK